MYENAHRNQKMVYITCKMENILLQWKDLIESWHWIQWNFNIFTILFAMTLNLYSFLLKERKYLGYNVVFTPIAWITNIWEIEKQITNKPVHFTEIEDKPVPLNKNLKNLNYMLVIWLNRYRNDVLVPFAVSLLRGKWQKSFSKSLSQLFVTLVLQLSSSFCIICLFLASTS